MRASTRHLTRFAILFATVGLINLRITHAEEMQRFSPEPGEPHLSVSTESVVELALTRNPDLLEARERVAEAQGLLRQARFRPNPDLDVSIANGDALGSAGERDLSFGYSHTFELGGKRGSRIEIARRGLDLAKTELANQERLLVYEARIKYAEALAGIRNVENADELLRLTGQSLDLAKARSEAGEGAPLEERLLQVELNRIRSDRLLFASQVEQVLLELKLLAGLPLDQSLRLSDSLEIPADQNNVHMLVETALSRRPDLTIARIREQLAEAELRLAKSTASPDLVARAGYSHVQSRFDQLGIQPGGQLVPLTDKDNIVSGTISIQLPLANRNEGNIEAAIARQRAARLHRESLERVVRQEVLTASSRLAAAREAARLFDVGVIKQSEENVLVVRGAYQLGELRLLDVINEQRRLIETQRAYTELLRDAWVAAAELDRATGSPLRVTGVRR